MRKNFCSSLKKRERKKRKEKKKKAHAETI